MGKLTTLLVPVADRCLTVKLARSLHNWLLALFLLFIWSSILHLQDRNSTNIFTYYKRKQIYMSCILSCKLFLTFLKIR